MTTQELEEKLDGAAETSSIEFKQQHEWDVLLFAKDILAISNVRDGGYIIVGVEDQTFQRQGVTPQQRASYNIEIMRDQMTRYADPHVHITVEFPKDKNGLEYVVIRVFQFEEIPVICRISDQRAGVRESTVYYRNTNRRVESAPVSNSYDFRTIIMSATARMMQRMREMHFTVEDDAQSKLNKELDGL
jgi:predicted HTH transcriptional regulator